MEILSAYYQDGNMIKIGLFDLQDFTFVAQAEEMAFIFFLCVGCATDKRGSFFLKYPAKYLGKYMKVAALCI